MRVTILGLDLGVLRVAAYDTATAAARSATVHTDPDDLRARPWEAERPHLVVFETCSPSPDGSPTSVATSAWNSAVANPMHEGLVLGARSPQDRPATTPLALPGWPPWAELPTVHQAVPRVPPISRPGQVS